MNVAQNVTELIGNTPLVKLNAASRHANATVLGKCEFMNPSSSVKDRIGANMIKRALERGEITLDSVLIEPTSGNTGIALASVAAGLGIRLILTMPSSMSIERRKLLKALGAEIVLTDPAKGMGGAVQKAKELSEEIENAALLQQFENPANPEIHELTTAEEIWRDTDGKIDIFVAGIGTGGTITGVGAILKTRNPEIKIIAVEPQASPILSGGTAGPHKIQGIGAGFIPKVLNTEIYDEIVQVSNDDAIQTAKEIAQDEGLLVGISAGSNVYAARSIAARESNQGKVVVTILCDTGERYISTGIFDDEEA